MYFSSFSFLYFDPVLLYVLSKVFFFCPRIPLFYIAFLFALQYLRFFLKTNVCQTNTNFRLANRGIKSLQNSDDMFFFFILFYSFIYLLINEFIYLFIYLFILVKHSL